MYRSDDNRFGWGMNFRSEVKAEAEGDYNYSDGTGATATGDAFAETALPMQISTGVDYALNDDWKLFGEVTYSNYSSNETIDFSGTDNINDNGHDMPVKAINANWDDQMNYRIAAEYSGIENWKLRAGYIYTTNVVPEEYASPTFSTPAIAHTFSMGAGTTIMNDQVDLDFAVVYDTVSADDAKGGGELVDGTPSTPGKYESEAYAFHMTARYRF